jgi:hypothetical protein
MRLLAVAVAVAVALAGCSGTGKPVDPEPPRVVDPEPPRAGACAVESDCALTMIPEEPGCCRELCWPRAIPTGSLAALEATQDALDCRAVLCPPPAPCPPIESHPTAACTDGACTVVDVP